MKKFYRDHEDLLTWLGRDLLDVAFEAWKGRLSDDEIRSRAEALPDIQRLPPAVRTQVADPVILGVKQIERKRYAIAYSRSMARFSRPSPDTGSIHDRVCRNLWKALYPTRYKSRFPLVRVNSLLVSDDVNVGICVTEADRCGDVGTRHELRVRAGSLKRVWRAGLGYTADNCVNLELRPIDMRVPGFDAYAAIWFNCSDAHLQRHDGVMLRHRATGAVRHGADLRAALERPVNLDEAEGFIRQSLQPLEKAIKRIRATGLGRDRKVELPIELAERIRAHLIWIGHQLGGPFEEIFSAAAKKGYMVRFLKREIKFFKIRSRETTYLRLCRFTPLTDQVGSVARFPSVPMASTAHEQIGSAAFRRKYGDEGLKFEP